MKIELDDGGDLDWERYEDKRQSEAKLASVGYDIAITLACSARRRGELSEQEEQMIQSTLDERANELAERFRSEPLRYARATIQQMTALWDASKP
jgi:hypothetical protein